MSVLLLAVKFNHNPSTSATNALNVRRNFTTFVNVPEWQRGISVNPADSVAAYSLRETRGNTVTIQAKFARRDLATDAVDVRAVHPVPLAAPSDLWLQIMLGPLLPWPALYFYYFWYYRSLLQAFAAPATPGVLGTVRQRRVTFRPDGETGFESFELENVQLAEHGVGVNNVTWEWQYRLGPLDPWKPFETSRHKIYSLLDTPTAPWQQLPFGPLNTQLPWTQVLDYACRWASGARTAEDAATRVTQAVFDLGSSILEYGCGINGFPMYSFPVFDCTEFLERLAGGIGNGRFLMCSDCATIVSTFSNALGCDLWQSKMFALSQSFFRTNLVRAIGSRRFEQPCGLSGFSFHEVAFTGECTEDDRVFDACLEVDRDLNPAAFPSQPLLPVNMRFGRPGERLYRDLLAHHTDRHECDPHPFTRQRRTVT